MGAFEWENTLGNQTDAEATGDGGLVGLLKRLRTILGGNLLTHGTVAHDSADSGNPVKIGGIADTTIPAAVQDGDRVNAAFDVHGRLNTRGAHQGAGRWAILSRPAANTVATATQAAAGVGIRNVCTEITVVIAANATAPTAVNVNASVIDGASGGTTYLWGATISLPATAGAMNGIAKQDVWFEGAANTALTIEFSAAGGANVLESVSASGLTVTE